MRTAVVLATCLLASLPAHALPPGARPGEAFTFKFSVGPVEGGRARMSIGKAVEHHGRHVVWVHGQAETTAFVKLLARMNDEYKLAVDTFSLLPLEVLETEKGLRERRISSTLDGRHADIDFWAPEKQLKGRRLLPRVARDPLTGLFALRALPLPDGQKLELDVIDGAALWRCKLAVHRGERLRLDGDAPGASARAAVRIDGLAQRIDDAGHNLPQPPRHLTIWLTDDAARVLLRLEADTDLGRCALELTSYLPAPASTAIKECAAELPGIETN
jgi:hypothetical protein